MSIAKNTPRRKKVAPENQSLQPLAKPRFHSRYVEKYPNLGVVHEAELRYCFFALPLPRLRAYGARFLVLMEALEAARQQPSAKSRRAVIKLIADLEQESRHRRYQQILHAIAEVVQSEAGFDRAFWTALRAVEISFAWTNEYMFAFSLYKQSLRHSRSSGKTARR